VRIVPAKCPTCGADLHLDPGLEVVTCAFCQKNAIVERPDHPPRTGSPDLPVIVIPRQDGRSVNGVVLGMVVLLVLGMTVAAGVALFVLRHARTSAKPVWTPSPTAPPTPRPPPTRRPLGLRLGSAGLEPLVADVNHDGFADLLLYHQWWSPETPLTIGAFDGRTGKRLWQTPALPQNQPRAGLVGNHLLVAEATGKLASYALADGSSQWAVGLTERVEWFCLGADPDHALLELATEKFVGVDLGSGEHQPVSGKHPCKKVQQGREPDTSARAGDTSGFPEKSVPVQQRSYHCGSTRVMGSIDMFVPDPCPRELGVSQKALGELDPRVIVAAGKGWVLIGGRLEGTHSPMVGYVEGKRSVWQAFLVSDNPLAADTSTEFAVGPTHLVVSYRLTEGRQPRLAAFEITTGRRSFDIPLPKDFSPDQLLATTELVVALKSDSVRALAMTDGHLVWQLGR
jgi:hypothetical protein